MQSPIEQKIKIPLNGKIVEGTDVPIKASEEGWGQYTLQDGSIIRVKISAMGFVRIDGEYDTDGNPVYAVKAALLTTPMTIPDNLKKPADSKKTN